jgi:sugar phosphate permease
MLALRDAVSILPQLSSLAAVAAINSTSTNVSPVTTTVALADSFRGGTNENVSSFGDTTAGIVLSLLPGNNARTLHAVLVASNLFWYQTIRQTVAVLSVFMCREFASMDTNQQAQLIAAPSVGNIVTQAVGGIFIRCLPGGTKTAITLAMVSLATGCSLLPMAMDGALASASAMASKVPGSFPLGTAFALLSLQGLVFGPMFPAHAVLLSKWLPPSERGSAMAYGEIAMSLASMGVPIFATAIASYTANAASGIAGWRNGFYVTGVACFGYLIAWILLGRSDPESCSYIARKELDLIRSLKQKSTGGKNRGNKSDLKQNSLPWQKILLHPSVLSLFFVHMAYNFVTLSMNSWMPTYYNDVLGLNPNDAKLHIVLPQLSALVIKLGVSKFARVLRKARKEKAADSGSSSDERSVILFSRKFMGYLGFAVMALPLFLLPLAAPAPTLSSSTQQHLSSSLSPLPLRYSPWWSTGLFSAALAGTGFHAESFRANYLDVTQQYVGLVSGVGNCLSSVSAMLAPFVVGKLISKTAGDWSPVWRLSALASLVAAFVFGAFSTTTPVEEQQKQPKC